MVQARVISSMVSIIHFFHSCLCVHRTGNLFYRLLHNSKMYISVFQRKQMYFSMYSDETNVCYTEKKNVCSCFAL